MTAVIARASQRRVSRVRQSALGTIAGASDAARTVRRSSTGLNLSRAAYASPEKRVDQQKADSGLGTHQVSGPLKVRPSSAHGMICKNLCWLRTTPLLRRLRRLLVMGSPSLALRVSDPRCWRLSVVHYRWHRQGHDRQADRPSY